MSQRCLEAPDRARVAAVFEAHRAFIETIAAGRTRPEDVADVVQDVGLRLCRYLPSLRDPGAVRAWVARVTVTATHDLNGARLARERLRSTLGDRVGPEEPETPAIDLAEAEDQAAAVAAVSLAESQLTPLERALVRDDRGDGAVYIGNSGARRMRASRARQKLRAILMRDPRVWSIIHEPERRRTARATRQRDRGTAASAQPAGADVDDE